MKRRSAEDVERDVIAMLAVARGTLDFYKLGQVGESHFRIASDRVNEALGALRSRNEVSSTYELVPELRESAWVRLRDAGELRPLWNAIATRSHRNRSFWRGPETALRDVLVGLLLGDRELVRAASKDAREAGVGVLSPEVGALGREPSLHALALVDPAVREDYARGAALHALDAFSGLEVVDAVFRDAPPADVAALRLARRFFEEGPQVFDDEAIRALERAEVGAAVSGVLGLAHFARGDLRRALPAFDMAFVLRSQPMGVALSFFRGLARIDESAPSQPEPASRVLPEGAEEALRLARTLARDPQENLPPWMRSDTSYWSVLARGLLHVWFCSDVSRRVLAADALERAASELERVPWLQRETHTLVARLRGESTPSFFASCVPIEPPWRRTLRRLERALAATSPPTDDVVELRYRWSIALGEDGRLTRLEAREQKRKNGVWSRGKSLDLARRLSQPIGDKLPEEDRRLLERLFTKTRVGARSLDGRVFFRDEVFLDALVGHPQVTRIGETEPVPVRRGTARLALVEGPTGFRLDVQPQATGLVDRGAYLEVVILDPRQAAAARSLGATLELPLTARAEVERLVAVLAPLFTVDVSAELSVATVDEVPPETTLRVRLRRELEGLTFELVVTPLGAEGPALRPGEGHPSLFSAGRRTVRALDAERAAITELCGVCPTLGGEAAGRRDLRASLDLLAELRDADACVEWTQGTPLRLERPQGQLAITTARRTDWLDASGGLEVDGTLVATFEVLLEAARRDERFVRVDDERFLELEVSLRRTLARLEAFREDDGLHPLVALLDEPNLVLRGDRDFGEERRRLQTAMSAEIEVPRTLEAELRPYQIEGFRWLARLARAGLGACLADDMGLGKTVQTIALLLDRARDGAAFVVAPTSVVANWVDELTRFAPSLRVQVVSAGIDAAQAEAIVRDADAFDVVLTSYGMLQSRDELFASRVWSTAILDEAQAIKNPGTKTARAVHALQADSRIALSGTPIENHLGELWSLFRFLVPGLLGSQRSFKGNFVKPIDDPGEQSMWSPGLPGRRLRERIRPFVLRRTKREVLRELPPRTELVLRVEPSAAQRAFSEALRRKDVEALTHAKDRRFALLAALTRARQACCAPSLVTPRTKVPSAKLEAFVELVDELRDGGHRALVFSQFVGLLTLAKRALDARGVSYQYLDGSTPAKRRKESVNAFQAGEGDLFLISLKAGGTGLNLTAADYVVHLDPWWNPAAEDQASDRAHRIGQTRPVTVYRLVLADSVEEKILELHAKKRELAEQLLADADDADVRLDLDALEQLLRG